MLEELGSVFGRVLAFVVRVVFVEWFCRWVVPSTGRLVLKYGLFLGRREVDREGRLSEFVGVVVWFVLPLGAMWITWALLSD